MELIPIGQDGENAEREAEGKEKERHCIYYRPLRLPPPPDFLPFFLARRTRFSRARSSLLVLNQAWSFFAG